MTELHQAEDAMVQALRTCLQLEPMQHFNKYMSPRILEWLDSKDDIASKFDDMADGPDADGPDGLVPFTKGRKEKRKPSYKIH